MLQSNMSGKPRVLLVGGGSVGAIAALNLETADQAAVTVVCRSNFKAVQDGGYHIDSCDHGTLEWKPTAVVSAIPTVTDGQAFDYIVCTTKNIADVPPPLSELISPAVTPGKTTIVLIQNGLNIEKPMFEAFPKNVVLSGVSLIGAKEPKPGHIHHAFPDTLFVSAFRNPQLNSEREDEVAKSFVELYAAGGKTKCSLNADVGWTRWRKLVYNACLNPICAITGLDTGRIRLADGAIEGLVRPAMAEIVAAARASGHELPTTVIDDMINVDPVTMYLPPSMQQDLGKGNFIEYENILGEPLREGEKLGVPMPTLKVLYHLCQAIQWKNKEVKGLVSVPPKD